MYMIILRVRKVNSKIANITEKPAHKYEFARDITSPHVERTRILSNPVEARRREYADYGYKGSEIDSEIAADFFLPGFRKIFSQRMDRIGHEVFSPSVPTPHDVNLTSRFWVGR